MVVIPGRCDSIEPGIHNHRRYFHTRWSTIFPGNVVPWLWIPGSLALRAPRNDREGPCNSIPRSRSWSGSDLEAWQKLNVASFLAGGIAAAFPECIGDAYEDGSGTKYLSLIGQPILIYGADRPALSRALERALARNITPALYTEDMFKTTHDAANREVVRAVARTDLNLVGLAMRAERKVIDKIVDGLKFHS